MIPVKQIHPLFWAPVFCAFSLFASVPADGASEPSPKEKAAWRAALAFHSQYRDSRKPDDRAKAAKAIGEALIQGAHLMAARLLVDQISGEIRRGTEGEEEVRFAVIEAAVEALWRIREENAIDWLARIIRDEKADWRIRFHVICGIRAGNCPAAVKALCDAAESRDERLRLAAMETFGIIRGEGSLDCLLNALGDSSWRIRIAAARSLSVLTLPDPEKDRVVSALIEALRKVNDEGGRVKIEMIFALRSLTGEKDAFDVSSWDHWLSVRKRAATGAPVVVTMPVAPTYHGVKIWSTRVVFVLDVTGSMADPATKTETTGGKETPSQPLPPVITGQPDEARKRTLLEKLIDLKRENDRRQVRAKIDAEKRELINAVLFLDEKVYFTIIFYAELPFAWKPSLVPATPENKIDAVKEIEKVGPLGGTDIYKALLAAFAVPGLRGPGAGEGRQGGAEPKASGGPRAAIEDLESAADEIFLLTDGAPTVGIMTDTDRLCEEIRKINRVRGLVINTIAVGTEGQGESPVNLKFMERLARENRGTFVHVK